jgi:hypothetical protein
MILAHTGLPVGCGVACGYESRLVSTACSRNRRRYSQSGQMPFLLIPVCPSDIRPPLRVNTQFVRMPDGTFMVKCVDDRGVS